MGLLEVLLPSVTREISSAMLRHDLCTVNSSPHQVVHGQALPRTHTKIFSNNIISLARTPSLVIVSSPSSTSVEKHVDRFRIIGGVKG